jgi:hypothetical protein
LLRRVFALDGRLAAAPRSATAGSDAADFVWQP